MFEQKQINGVPNMRLSFRTLLAAILICQQFVSAESIAKETKGETLHGVVESVDGNKITVNHRRKSRTFALQDNTKINYVSFLNTDEELKAGFFIRAGVDPNGSCKVLWITLPIPEAALKPSKKMLTMTPAELHEMADSNDDGELSYVEYATAIYRSPKHGPVGFEKSDKDDSGTLNLREFKSRLEDIKWWKISRKTPAEWHAEFDNNSDGVLNKQEFASFLGSSAHLDVFVNRADKDLSGEISLVELSGFIDTILY